MITCTKRYEPIPFAHRQPVHKGHCRLIHGHDWVFEFEFAANELDECGFVVDFGGLKPLREWLVKKFDHAFAINATDPELKRFQQLEADNLCQLAIVPDCSAEGLALFAMHHANELISVLTKGRVWVKRCTVFEDARNSATVTT